MRNVKVIDVINAYEFDIKRLTLDKKNSNRTKLIQRDKYMLQFLRTLPENMLLSCEGTPSDEYKLNAGSITEMILKYHAKKDKEGRTLEKAGGLYDTKQGCINVEIKLSLNGSCYNTPIQENCLIYLVNRDGVYMVRKDEIDEIVHNKKLPYNEWENAHRIEWLSERMGFNK